MKRYALFSGANYYPGGGWDDFVAAFDAADEATTEGLGKLKRKEDDWFQVVDLHTGERVEAS